MREYILNKTTMPTPELPIETEWERVNLAICHGLWGTYPNIAALSTSLQVNGDVSPVLSGLPPRPTSLPPAPPGLLRASPHSDPPRRSCPTHTFPDRLTVRTPCVAFTQGRSAAERGPMPYEPGAHGTTCTIGPDSTLRAHRVLYNQLARLRGLR